MRRPSTNIKSKWFVRLKSGNWYLCWVDLRPVYPSTVVSDGWTWWVMSWLSSKLVTVDKGSEKSVWQCVVMGGPDGWSGGSGCGPVQSAPGDGLMGDAWRGCRRLPIVKSRGGGRPRGIQVRIWVVPWFLGGKALLPKRSMSSSQNSCLPFAISYLVILSSCQPAILSSF